MSFVRYCLIVNCEGIHHSSSSRGVDGLDEMNEEFSRAILRVIIGCAAILKPRGCG